MNEWEVAVALHRLELLRKIRIRRQMAALGMHPGQPRMMEYIHAHPGCTQQDVACHLDITPASAAASLKRMEKAGHVRRIPDAKDARRNCLHLTGEGTQLMFSGRAAMDKLDKDMLLGLKEEDRQHLKALCDKMFENLADETTRDLNICRLHQVADAPIPKKEDV